MLILRRRKISFDIKVLKNTHFNKYKTLVLCEKIIIYCVIKTSLAINKDLRHKINGQFDIAMIKFFNQEINLIFHENSVVF